MNEQPILTAPNPEEGAVICKFYLPGAADSYVRLNRSRVFVYDLAYGGGYRAYVEVQQGNVHYVAMRLTRALRRAVSRNNPDAIEKALIDVIRVLTVTVASERELFR